MSAFACSRCGWVGSGADGCGTHGCNTVDRLAVRDVLLHDLRAAGVMAALARARAEFLGARPSSLSERVFFTPRGELRVLVISE